MLSPPAELLTAGFNNFIQPKELFQSPFRGLGVEDIGIEPMTPSLQS